MTVTPLDAEIAQLERELSADPRVARLEQLKRMRRDYLALPSIEPAAATSAAGANGGAHPEANGSAHTEPRSMGRRRSPERERAIQESRKLLAGKTLPTRLPDIDAHLGSLGIRIGGNDPLNNLSALLSTCGEFRAHGRAGWTLIEGAQ